MTEKTEMLGSVLAWVRTTDLVEVSLREGGRSFSFSSAPLHADPGAFYTGPRLVPVVSPAVGLFQWAEPGKPRLAEEGREVKASDALGLVDPGRGKTHPVAAPSAGVVRKVLVEAGEAVQYGQPLFIIEPR